MNPRIEICQPKKLVGIRLMMSMADHKVGAVWRRFGPRQKEIRNRKNSDAISMAIYSPEHFSDFKPTNEFERWAAVEVSDYDEVPFGLETFDLPEGQYAVFDYKGLNTDSAIYQYIFKQWLPQSAYQLDHRPHFEVLGEKYKNNDPESEEEIWIPIRK